MIETTIKTEPLRILDYDVETVAAGFADPNWVPQRITAIAWSWVGEDHVECVTRLEGAEHMLDSFLEAYDAADMVTGHNLIRFDQPIVSAECLRLGLEPLGAKMVQDTMRLVKAKGFKKGQDNLATLVGVPYRKLSLDWQDWEDAYEWDRLIAGDRVAWKVVRDRVTSDVLQHKLMRIELIMRGWLKPPILWRP